MNNLLKLGIGILLLATATSTLAAEIGHIYKFINNSSTNYYLYINNAYKIVATKGEYMPPDNLFGNLSSSMKLCSDINRNSCWTIEDPGNSCSNGKGYYYIARKPDASTSAACITSYRGTITYFFNVVISDGDQITLENAPPG